LRQPRDKKFHRSWPKLSQVENTNCPTMVATSLDCPFGDLLFGFRSSCIDDVSYISVPDHTAALLAPSSPIHCVSHRTPSIRFTQERSGLGPWVRLASMRRIMLSNLEVRAFPRERWGCKN